MNSNTVITLPATPILQPLPAAAFPHFRRTWMARVELALFASVCGYFALSLLNAASLA